MTGIVENRIQKQAGLEKRNQGKKRKTQQNRKYERAKEVEDGQV